MPGKKKTTKKATKKNRKKKTASSTNASTPPAFPYSNKPNSLRKFLEQIPQKPRPPKVNVDTLKAWGLRDSNDQSIIRVLKALGFVSSNNEPTDRYTEFMTPGQGPGVLADAVKEVWAPLFQHSHTPHREDDATLKNYFNIHSGGSDKTLAYQIQTFKAACDHSDFDSASLPTSPPTAPSANNVATHGPAGTGSSAEPKIHIDLHIHLPENKSRRDYEYIFEDIAKYIFGRKLESSGDE